VSVAAGAPIERLQACMHNCMQAGVGKVCGALRAPSQEVVVILAIAAVLLVLWLLGFLVFHITVFAIHVLLILAVVALIAHFVMGGRNRSRL
jgi:hypothetical protein